MLEGCDEVLLDGVEELLLDGVEVLLLDGVDEVLLDGVEELLLEGVEDDGLGLLVGLLELLCDDWPMPPLELEELAPPCSAARVFSSSWPDGERLFCCWNCFNAACVFGPIWPSTGPGSIPLSFSACCAWRTSDCPPLCMEDVSDDCPYPPDVLVEAPLLVAEDDPLSYCDWAAAGAVLLDVFDLSWPALARTAVLEKANAAMTIDATFMVILS